MVKLPKFLKAVVFQTKWTAIELNYGPSFIYAHAIKFIGLKEAQNGPLKSPKLTLWTKMTTKWYRIDKYSLFSPKSLAQDWILPL